MNGGLRIEARCRLIVALMPSLVGALLACGGDVEVAGAGGATAASVATTASSGDAGCGDGCIQCCNDPACPDDVPLPYAGCFVESGTHCGWIDDDGCVDSRYCENKKWNAFWDPTCPGECPETILAGQDICLDVGLECLIEGDNGCVTITCGEDHRWTELSVVSCP